MFDTVLVANRGEIAVRVLRTLRHLGIRGVAVYSDADAGSRHVAEADEAYRIGPGPALDSYLRTDAILGAAERSGADAVHPGYGFLSERASFARACAAAGVTFIGPPAEAIELMGDKIRAKLLAAETGVPVVPGRAEPGLTDDDLLAAAGEIGFPVLLKPSAGGGGKGMHRVDDASALRAAIETARREARGAFGDDSLFVERWVDRPRHVEIQVFADRHGAVVHLGERECSLQRRHQKIVEEAPSPALDDTTRKAMAGHAVALARRCGYVGAGTVEFVVPSASPDTFYFLEMNTRLQVEHPVTELVTGLDLVELQLRVAAGERLPFAQEEVTWRGHAVEARVYAEDPASGFLPTGGPVLACAEPAGPGVRVDSGIGAGTTVSTLYDPMLAKVVAWAPERDGARRRLRRALGQTAVLGLRTNVAFLRSLLADADVVAGTLDTGLVDRHAASVLGTGTGTGTGGAGSGGADRGGDDPQLGAGRHALGAVGPLVAAAVADATDRTTALAGPSESRADRWQVADGWRLGERAWDVRRYEVDGGRPVTVRVRRAAAAGDEPGAWDVEIDGPDGIVAVDGARVSTDGARLTLAACGRTRHFLHARQGTARWLGSGGTAWSLRAARSTPGSRGGEGTGGTGGAVRSPMPGQVAAVAVAPGDVVAAGDPLVMVEAMKMEHTLSAPVDGVVTEVAAEVGAQVGMDEVLVVVSSARPGTPGTSEAPGTPGTSEAPGAPGTSEAPGAPGTSEAPGAPGTSEAPGAPAGADGRHRRAGDGAR